MIAGVATVFILVIQAGLRPLERRFFDHHAPQQITLRVRRGAGPLAAMEGELARAGLDVRGLRMRPVRGGTEDRIEITLVNLPLGRASTLLEAIRQIDGVRTVSYSLGVPRPASVDPSDGDDAMEDDETDN